MLITTKPTSTKQRQAIGSRQLASILIFVLQFPAVTVSHWIKWQPQGPVNSWLAVQAPIPPSVSQTMSIFRATKVHPVQKEHIHRKMWLRSQIMLDTSRMVEGVLSNQEMKLNGTNDDKSPGKWNAIAYKMKEKSTKRTPNTPTIFSTGKGSAQM